MPRIATRVDPQSQEFRDNERAMAYRARVMINAFSRYYFWFFGFQSPWQRKGYV